jgi:hypothetical protein
MKRMLRMKKLRSEEDAFGHALLASFKGEEVNEIIERLWHVQLRVH